jgi:hypothetical protein
VNIFELVYVLIAIGLSYFLGKYRAAQVGWPGWILGVAFGIGGWIAITSLLIKRFGKRRH